MRRGRARCAAVLVSVAALAGGAVALAGPTASSAMGGAPAAVERASQAQPGTSGAVTIRVAVDAKGRGTFMADGAISDAGPARVTRSRSGSRVTTTQTLSGNRGSFVIRVVQRCRKTTSAWSAVSGSGEYQGLTGGGTGTGPARCGAPARPTRAVYRGTVHLPAPAPLAAPGLYGGWTAQKERITLEVLPGGRLVSAIRVERLVAACTPPLEVVVEPAFPGAHAIASDGSFSATFGSVTISGRFGQAGAEGSLTYGPAERGSATCSSGPVTWTASSPPTPLPVAVPGAYCGSTTQGVGICLTLTPSGHVTRVRVEFGVECTQPEQARFDAVAGFGGAVPVRSNLRFDVDGSVDEGASGEYALRGTFDTAGGATGTLSAFRLTVDVEGTIYTCRATAVGWSAKRVG